MTPWMLWLGRLHGILREGQETVHRKSDHLSKFRMTYNAPSYLQVPHPQIWRDDCDKVRQGQAEIRRRGRDRGQDVEKLVTFWKQQIVLEQYKG